MGGLQPIWEEYEIYLKGDFTTLNKNTQITLRNINLEGGKWSTGTEETRGRESGKEWEKRKETKRNVN